MIIKVFQDRTEVGAGIAFYCYEADGYTFVDEGEKQYLVIHKDGKEDKEFTSPIFNKVYICNSNGKTIDTITFRKIENKDGVASNITEAIPPEGRYA